MLQASQKSNTPVAQLVQDYCKVTTLKQGALPERVIKMLEETGYDVLKELANEQAQTWDEFAAKVSTLVGALNDPLPGWLNHLKDSFAADLLALPVPSFWDDELAQAAE
ncbi:hypothetical protein ACKWRH_20790 [Bradyrhizobium sp. Pa8]|uniref:hypothetical protein n=1 Tax=Bradyrhizobium sp. Pa8 TaxID=3386552 RepID=UPI00403FBD8B